MLCGAVLAVAASGCEEQVLPPADALTGGTGECTPFVVACNYVNNYIGTFNWTIVLQSSIDRYEETVSVGIGADSVVSCAGEAKDTYYGQTKTGQIIGPGLLAVEFTKDANGKLVYEITAACPTPAYPGEVVQPAELGVTIGLESYEQPATSKRMNLQGGSTYPAPETDPLNGVSGTVSVTWNFKHK